MPSNHNTRSKRAATTSAPNQPPSRRPRRSRSSATANATALAASHPSGASTSTLPTVAAVNLATTSPEPSAAISAELLEQIVSTVTAEVTRRLTPLSQPELASDAIVEAPVVTPAATSSVPQLPGAAVVEQALHSAHSAITGETEETLSAMPTFPGQPYHSVTLPLDSRASIKLKKKIWDDVFIDFGSLLSNPVTDNKFQLSVKTSSDGLAPSLSLDPVTKPQKVASVSVWMSAFRIFVGVYTQKYPHESPALMKYGDIVQDLADRGHNWRFYDENFRFLRQNERSALPWGNVHWELWLRSQYSTNKPAGSVQRAGVSANKPPFLNIPRGHCFKFHKGDACSGCDLNTAVLNVGARTPHYAVIFAAFQRKSNF